jgi:exonuclease SbcC
MIVRSMRLKNIKSYGEGPNGEGVTISFEPGTNRIAGKNGHGKTTLIESLGYALFLTEPIFEESFQLDKYFLRAGKKVAEIDVTFSHQGEFYRIERGLGPSSKRQAKVVELENGSTCAEGAREVSAFLCRLFDLPNPKRFSELFYKLVGVRQGRLAWPFDSKPSAAKEFFEPLLDVAVFRECFQSLKPAVDEFTARLHEQEKIRAGVEERIRERSDSAALLEVKRRHFREIDQQLQASNKAQEIAGKRLAELEAKEISLRAAASGLEAARNALGLARHQREIADQRMRESAEAVGVMVLAASGYNSFEKAEKELHELRVRQAEQHRLEREIDRAEKKKIQLDEKSNAARSQRDVFARQKEGKRAERLTILERVEALRSRLCASQPECEKQRSLANRAAHGLSDIRHFVSSFAAFLVDGETTLNKMKEMTAALGGRDVSALQTAWHEEEGAAEALQSISQQLAAAKAEHSTLLRQLEEIGGGLCPFLKEQCRQFDPSKVEVDLKEMSATVETLQKKKEIAESVLRAAQTDHEQRRKEEQDLVSKRSQLEQMVVDFLSGFERLDWGRTGEAVNELRGWIHQVKPKPLRPNLQAMSIDADAVESNLRQNTDYLKELEEWWQTTEEIAQERIHAVLEEEGRRNSDQRDEFNSADRLRQIESEIEKLGVAEDEQREVAARCERGSVECVKEIASLDQRRRGFGFLGDEIVRLERLKQTSRSDYERYLGAKPLADERSIRETVLHTQRDLEGCAVAELRRCESILSELSRVFDEADLTTARREFGEISAAVATKSANLDNVRRETDREEGRFREWEAACARRDQIDDVMRRLAAAGKLTELARVALRDAAPIVAQHLCDRIAGQAQRIFNRINHDPVELRWEAAPRYSMRVIPGDRRFAMMSGGEQTKLALAMTLAMIQEFSGLRFCIFDEPTYGVDAESREKLGDALLESQKAADLEQLILVSHDDAFDGKIEHSIYLRKTAANGTEVVQFAGHANGREHQNSVAGGA